jgi:hypothetical protein
VLDQAYPSGGSGPYNLAAGDLDGDGDLDLVVPNQASGTVGVLRNDGTGHFAPVEVFSSAGTSPYSAAVADVNGDARLDILVANRSGGSLAVLLADGQGGFAAPEVYITGMGAFAVAAADFNGDGLADAVTASPGAGGVSLFLANLQPTFTLVSAGGLPFDVETQGFGAGQLVQGPANAFDGLNRLQVNGEDYHTGTQRPELDDEGHTLVMPTVTVGVLGGMSGLEVCREVTVPSAGGEDFARTVDVVHNVTGSAVTVTVRVVGNLGSDADTVVFNTSDGDTVVEAGDWWFGTDDADGSGAPAVVHLVHGPYGLQPSAVNVIGDNVEWEYEVTVGDGETVRLAHFTVLGDTRAEAEAAAAALVGMEGFGGKAASYLTEEEVDALANFVFNAAPTDIALSNDTVAENAPAGTTVGTLSATDPNGPGDFTYELVSSGMAGDNDNALFSISGDTLRTAAPLNFERVSERQSSYKVRVKVTDQGGLSFEKVLTVHVTDVNDGPVLGGAVPGQQVNDNETVTPFTTPPSRTRTSGRRSRSRCSRTTCTTGPSPRRVSPRAGSSSRGTAATPSPARPRRRRRASGSWCTCPARTTSPRARRSGPASQSPSRTGRRRRGRRASGWWPRR